MLALLIFSFPLSVSVSPTISDSRMPHVALSALVIDSHVRWYIDRRSSPRFSNCGSGPQPHHHYSLWPIDLPGRGASGPGCPNQRLFFFHIWYSHSLSVSLPPACGQLSRRRTITLMFSLLAFMSDAMELCVGAKVVAPNPKGGRHFSVPQYCCPVW